MSPARFKSILAAVTMAVIFGAAGFAQAQPVPGGASDRGREGAGIADPVVTSPEVTAPGIASPGVSAPGISEPNISRQRVADPRVTEPDVSAPRIVPPAISDPYAGAAGTPVK